MTLDSGLRSAWLIHPHFLSLWLSQLGLVLLFRCSSATTSGQLILWMFPRHLLVNACSWLLVTHHVSEPWSMIDLTLVLKIRILLWNERAVDLQNGCKVLKARFGTWRLRLFHRLYWLHYPGKHFFQFCWCLASWRGFILWCSHPWPHLYDIAL